VIHIGIDLHSRNMTLVAINDNPSSPLKVMSLYLCKNRKGAV